MPALLSRTACPLLLASSLLAACGGGSEPVDGGPTDMTAADGGGSDMPTFDSGPAAHEVLCLSAGTSCGGATPVCCAHATVDTVCFEAGAPDGGMGGVGGCMSTWTGFDAPSCVASAAACTELLSLACDGSEDCGPGEACCATASSFVATCQTSCPTVRTGVLAQVCHDHTQCPTDYPACCVLASSTGPALTFGLCTTVAGEASIDFPVHCDMP